MSNSKDILVFHGRFQPYHLGHHWLLKYLIAQTDAKVVIGIINPDPWDIWQSDEPNFHRFTPSRNPLTYWDRYACISRSISDLSSPERVLGVVPMPRPSVNFEKCKRFLPTTIPKLVLSLRYGDETEQWKKERYESLGLDLFTVMERQIPKNIVPISGTIVRDLMALRDDTWKKLVPKTTIEYLIQDDVVNRVIQTVGTTNALYRIKEFANCTPYKEWSRSFLNVYVESEKTKMGKKKHKHDIIGAIAESLFSIFPVFKGLLRLRDDECRAKQEEAVLNTIREQGQQTVEHVEKLLANYDWNCIALKSRLFRHVYAESMLSVANAEAGKQEAVISELGTGKRGFGKLRGRLAEEVYLQELIKLYGASLDDFWILVQDYGFDPSYVKGKSPRAKLRSFMQVLGTLNPETIISILGAIQREYPHVQVFKNVFNLATEMVD